MRSRWQVRTIPTVLVVSMLSAMAGAQTYSIVHAFGSWPQLPTGTLLQGPDATFYGQSIAGMFQIGATGDPRLLNPFEACDGLVLATDGYFYGTTTGDGVTNHGTVCRMDSQGSILTLHVFNGSDGTWP